MYGAILGDIIGSPYEFDRGDKTKDFPLFDRGARYTDDSVMTIAVAQALMETRDGTDDEIRAALIYAMRHWGVRYPEAGYGGMFCRWLREEDPKPYGSYGNGSAMRVSSVGWLYDDLDRVQKVAALTAEVTHNHPEGMKGAECVASLIWMARNGCSMKEMKDYARLACDYRIHTCDTIRPGYHHVETCLETVPPAISAFLEGRDFEDVIRNAVSLGGDCDTLTCIAGSIAEAFYGVPDHLKAECKSRLPRDMVLVLERFDQMRGGFPRFSR